MLHLEMKIKVESRSTPLWKLVQSRWWEAASDQLPQGRTRKSRRTEAEALQSDLELLETSVFRARVRSSSRTRNPPVRYTP